MKILVFNPGSNSLKAGVVDCRAGERSAWEGTRLVELIAEGIGGEAKLAIYEDKKEKDPRPIRAGNFGEAAISILDWLSAPPEKVKADWRLADIECVGIRVVHGGARWTQPVVITDEVDRGIRELAAWAPQHNPRSAEIFSAIRGRFEDCPICAVFDTAFHSTIPDRAALYAIPIELSRKHQIRRYGFHGISHRYLMERYAAIKQRPVDELKLVTLHLESGCSATAIAYGKSVDNTMGLTPLEGLMMGTRCGDVDAALVPFLMQAEGIGVDETMEILEKKSGLLGVSGKSLDTRVLMKSYATDEHVRLAMQMFCLRVRKAVGAMLAELGGADAIIFGGGIGENTPLVRKRVCDGLRWSGLQMDEAQNAKLIDVEGRLTAEGSPIEAYVIPTDETLEIAHECVQMLTADARQRPIAAA